MDSCWVFLHRKAFFTWLLLAVLSAEKKRLVSPKLSSSSLLKTHTVRAHHEATDKQISLITTCEYHVSLALLCLSMLSPNLKESSSRHDSSLALYFIWYRRMDIWIFDMCDRSIWDEKRASISFPAVPSYESVPALALNATTTTSLSASMPLLQRTLTDPRPTGLTRHSSFESPESLDPNWMNQRIVPVYQLLSGANHNASSSISTAAAASSSVSTTASSSSSSIAAALPTLHSSLKPIASLANSDKVSLVTHSPVNVLKTSPAAVLSGPTVVAHPTPSVTLTTAAKSHQVGGATQLVLPFFGAGDNVILRNLTSAGGRQPIVLMPLAASSGANPSPSLVPIQLVPDTVLSSAGLINSGFDRAWWGEGDCWRNKEVLWWYAFLPPFLPSLRSRTVVIISDFLSLSGLAQVSPSSFSLLLLLTRRRWK